MRSSYLDIQALAECDPGLRPRTLSDDDTEVDISLKSSLDGASVMRTNSAFERDSGVGTLREDYDSETEELQNSLKMQMRPSTRVYFPYPPYQNNRSSRHYRTKEKRMSLDSVTYNNSEDEFEEIPLEKKPKTIKKRKVKRFVTFLSTTSNNRFIHFIILRID